MIRHSAWALPLALFQIFSTACVTDLADGYKATATVTASNATTPIPGLAVTSYEAVFFMNDGTNIARTYTTNDGAPIVTDANGKFSIQKFDLDLYRIETDYECYDTCVDWDTDCYVDSWGDYVCHDYCSWYVTDCYDREYAVGADVGSIAVVTTFLNYNVGASSVRTLGLPVSETRDVEANTWIREERFITPISASASQPVDGSTPALKSLPQPKRTACEGQDELSEEQMATLRKLRESLGVSEAEVACRQ